MLQVASCRLMAFAGCSISARRPRLGEWTQIKGPSENESEGRQTRGWAWFTFFRRNAVSYSLIPQCEGGWICLATLPGWEVFVWIDKAVLVR